MISELKNYLGIHESALNMQSRRAELLAANLANVDTPGFKARDIDFRQAMLTASGEDGGTHLNMTNTLHMLPDDETGGFDVQYRQPYQASLDGNTVEHQVELAAYSDNAMRYLASLRILNNKLNTLRTAIRGQ